MIVSPLSAADEASIPQGLYTFFIFGWSVEFGEPIYDLIYFTVQLGSDGSTSASSCDATQLVFADQAFNSDVIDYIIDSGSHSIDIPVIDHYSNVYNSDTFDCGSILYSLQLSEL